MAAETSVVRTVKRSLFLALLALAGCNNSHFEEPEIQGHPGLVQAGDATALWVLQKQEEIRRVGVGGGGRRSSGIHWREDHYFHFDVKAFDPATARPVWSRLLCSHPASVRSCSASGPGIRTPRP